MREVWLQTYSSVFSLTFENADGRLSSGSAFKVGNLLVTNNHVIQVPNYRHVRLRSVAQDGSTTRVDTRFGNLEFKSFLVDGDPETGWDYAILKIPDPAFLECPSLELGDIEEVNIGQRVAALGYQFEQAHLSMHTGYVSSMYARAGVDYLQLDMSVNHGNSGGPLIDANSGRVLGLVTRKATGLTEQFDALLAASRQNVAFIEQQRRMGVTLNVSGFDFVAATLSIHAQMERVALEIARSSNVGIGYAYQVSKLRESLAWSS